MQGAAAPACRILSSGGGPSRPALQKSHPFQLRLQLGHQLGELDGPLLLGLHHLGGRLVHKSGVTQLGIQLLQLGGLLFFQADRAA